MLQLLGMLTWNWKSLSIVRKFLTFLAQVSFKISSLILLDHWTIIQGYDVIKSGIYRHSVQKELPCSRGRRMYVRQLNGCKTSSVRSRSYHQNQSFSLNRTLPQTLLLHPPRPALHPAPVPYIHPSLMALPPLSHHLRANPHSPPTAQSTPSPCPLELHHMLPPHPFLVPHPHPHLPLPLWCQVFL